MNLQRLTLLLFVAGLLAMGFNNPAQAQDITSYGPFIIQRFSEADGLISSEVNGLYKDKQGFMWVSTFNGLSRFDGSHFENFNRQSGLTESNVEIIGDDDAGQLLIRSVSNIYQYTGSQTSPFIKYPISGGFISTACPAKKGTAWVAYEGKTGLSLLSATGPVERLPTASPVLRMLKDSSGKIYVLQLNGVVSLLHNHGLVPVYTIHSKQPFTNEGVWISLDPAGNLWTYGANNTCLRRLQGTTVTDSIAVPAATSWWAWSVGNAGHVYMTLLNGSVYQLQNGGWKEILTKAQINGSIFDVVEDAGGNLWITVASGLLKISRKKYTETTANGPLAYYTLDKTGNYILRNDTLLYTIPMAVQNLKELQQKPLLNVYVSRTNEVWYCTEDAVYFLSPGKALQQVNTSGTYEGTKSKFRFRRVLEDDQGGIWITTYHGIFYKKSDSLHYYFKKEGLEEGAVYTAAIDKAGVFYVAGVHVYAFGNGRFQNISGQLGLPDEISRLATDQHKNLWVSQGTNKLVRVKSEAGGRFSVADSVLLSINDRPVSATSVCFDVNNNLWGLR